MQGFIVVTCSFWGEFELNLCIICLRFITNIINYVTGLADTKKCPQDLTFTKNRSHVAKKWRKKWENSAKKLQYKQTCQVFRLGPETPSMHLILPPSWYITKISRQAVNSNNFLVKQHQSPLLLELLSILFTNW